jgi:hypothetical protein
MIGMYCKALDDEFRPDRRHQKPHHDPNLRQATAHFPLGAPSIELLHSVCGFQLAEVGFELGSHSVRADACDVAIVLKVNKLAQVFLVLLPG